MSIRIESVRLENVGRFGTEYQLTFGDASDPAVVVGGTDTGKTTIINAIQFCLGGGIQSQTSSLNSGTLTPVNVLDQRSFGETVHGEVAVTMTDTASDTRYRLTRGFQTTLTRDGPEDAIQPVRGGKEENETWVSTDSEQIINAVYPRDARPFLILDSTIAAGIQPQDREIDFDRLVDRLHRAAVSQANARAELSLSSAIPEHRHRDVLLNKRNRMMGYATVEYSSELQHQVGTSETSKIMSPLSSGERLQHQVGTSETTETPTQDIEQMASTPGWYV